ncbi:MAG: hypothetical protein ACI38Q_00165 [Candidatus Bruticola sp.]
MIKSFGSAVVWIMPLLFGGLLFESALPYSWPHPELIIIWLSIIALRYGMKPGAVFGAACGAMAGVFCGCSSGWLALAYASLGGAVGAFLKPYSDRPFIYVLTVTASTVVFAAELTVLSMLGADLPSQVIFKIWLWKALLWNVIFLWPSLWLADKILGTYAFIPLELDCE